MKRKLLLLALILVCVLLAGCGKQLPIPPDEPEEPIEQPKPAVFTMADWNIMYYYKGGYDYEFHFKSAVHNDGGQGQYMLRLYAWRMGLGEAYRWFMDYGPVTLAKDASMGIEIIRLFDTKSIAKFKIELMMLDGGQWKVVDTKEYSHEMWY